ncbi:sugar phosphate isomerase/epimerase [Bacillus aquiflavi]|uniref:Sugar phosphate isomerase/epimerase n=1 Tax=Bacillus aquiflavi TaxID=2672567 RepID=A0A6B3VXV0_9BACI|nr:sugar phosphate isomerase/epimerase family protein [Bacillus aquiflavi]MBA4536770.1 sugar phosphate isomerase/epimerase [Bacillus aquiflavi]NEY81137.1 sugar phosphate isomerase/epimerase [Bacillus aquiflavi]UAC49699.1 sugar phosphate isomerase/epimerase [Bacillus aquiflavi]
MNLLFASTLAWSYPIDVVMKMANSENFTGVEVWAEHVWAHETALETIKSTRKQLNLLLTMHAASWDLNLCALNSGIRKQSIQEIKRSIELAIDIGANNVTFHPGKMTLTSFQSSFHEQLLVESIAEIMQFAKQEGITMSLEMMEWKTKEFVTEPAIVTRLTEPFTPYLKTTFDVAHIPLHENIVLMWENMPHVNKIHISDATAEKLHLPLGEGSIKRDTLSTFLHFEQFPIVIEGFDSSKELTRLKKNIDYVKKQISQATYKGVHS